MFSREEARELLSMIEEAYQTLGNQSARAAYDDSLSATAGDGPAPAFAGASSAEPTAMPSLDQAFAPVPEAAMAMAGKAGLAKNPPEAGALNHEALPDFSLSDGDASQVEFVVRKREAAKAALPSGQGRTSLSTYKIDEAVEAEIAARDEWDGAFLGKVRAYKNVSLDKLSDATRVSRAYLAAVEASDFRALPAPVFVRGFVAQTARILGLDEARVATSYMKLLKAASGAKK
jgi:hypothetical protein